MRLANSAHATRSTNITLFEFSLAHTHVSTRARARALSLSLSHTHTIIDSGTITLAVKQSARELRRCVHDLRVCGNVCVYERERERETHAGREKSARELRRCVHELRVRAWVIQVRRVLASSVMTPPVGQVVVEV
jgi:hypothetical protein